MNSFPVGIAEMPEDGAALLKAAVAGRSVVTLDKLSETLRGMGVTDSITIEGATPALHVYHYRKGERDIFMLMNVSSAETLDLKVCLPAAESYGLCDASKDCTFALDAPDGVRSLTVAPYQSVVLVTNPKSTVPMEVKAEKLCGSLALENFDLVLKPVVGDAETIADFALKPVSNIRRDFSGEMTYTAKFTLDKVPARAAFAAQYVFECMELTVNGKALPRVYTPPYEQDITEALREGENEIIVRVVSTALRDANTKPGIFGKERTILEPTGMFGTVEIRLYE